MRLQLGGGRAPGPQDQVRDADVRAAADPARRRPGRPAPELARRVDVAQERAQQPARHQHVGRGWRAPRRRTAASRARAAAADRRRSRPAATRPASLRGPRGSSTAARSRRPTSRRRTGRAARAPPRARRSPAPRRSGSCASPAWPPCGAPPRCPTASGSASAAGEARRGPVVAVALLAVGVVAQRLDHERHVRAAQPTENPADVANAVAPTIAPEHRAVGVGDALVERQRRRLAARARAGAPRATSSDSTAVVPQIELGDVARHLLGRRAARARSGSASAASSTLSRASRSSARGVRSDVYVTAARWSLSTRRPSARLPASFTSSGSPRRTLTSSSVPSRTSTSAPSAPALRAIASICSASCWHAFGSGTRRPPPPLAVIASSSRPR